jgi:hypothetical protein
MFISGRPAGKVAIVNQIGAIDELQAEIETLRNALVRLAKFVGGNPCWCDCKGGKHSNVCRDILKLKLWPRVTINGRASYHDNLPWKDAASKTRKAKS